MKSLKYSAVSSDQTEEWDRPILYRVGEPNLKDEK